MPSVARRSNESCSNELLHDTDDSSTTAQKGRSHASDMSSAVGSVACGPTENCALAGEEAARGQAMEPVAYFGNLDTAEAAYSKELCKNDGCGSSADDVEMVNVLSGAQEARSSDLAGDNNDGARDSFNFLDAGDQDYRRPPRSTLSTSGLMYGKTYTASNASERPGHHVGMSSYRVVNSQANRHTDQPSAAVDMAYFEGADAGGTANERNEQRNALTSRPPPAIGSVIRQLFNGENGTADYASAKMVSKPSSGPTSTSTLPFLLQSSDGSPLPNVVHFHRLKNSTSDLELNVARPTVKSPLFDDPNESATSKRLRDCKKKYLKRQPPSVKAEQLPGFVGDRDIPYLLKFVEGNIQEHEGDTSKASNGIETKREKKKEKCKKTATSTPEKSSSPVEDTAASMAVSQLSLAATGAEHTQPNTVTAGLIGDANDVSSVPVPGSDEAFLVVDRKKKKKVKPVVARWWPARPPVSGLPSYSMISSITFGSEHSSFVLPPADRAADSSSCTSDMRSDAGSDAYPSLARLPPIPGTSASGVAYDGSNKASLTTASGSSEVLTKEEPPKESWAAVAARGLLRGRGTTSTPVTAGGIGSSPSSNTDSTAYNSREHAASGSSHVGCQHGVGCVQSKLDDEETHRGACMPLPCSSAPPIGHHASDTSAMIGVGASTSDASALAEVLRSKGVEFVGVQRLQFLSRPSFKISFSCAASDMDISVCPADEAADSEAGAFGTEKTFVSPDKFAPGLEVVSGFSLNTPANKDNLMDECCGTAFGAVVDHAAAAGVCVPVEATLAVEQESNNSEAAITEDDIPADIDIAHMETVRHLSEEWLQVQQLRLRDPSRVVLFTS